MDHVCLMECLLLQWGLAFPGTLKQPVTSSSASLMTLDPISIVSHLELVHMCLTLLQGCITRCHRCEVNAAFCRLHKFWHSSSFFAIFNFQPKPSTMVIQPFHPMTGPCPFLEGVGGHRRGTARNSGLAERCRVQTFRNRMYLQLQLALRCNYVGCVGKTVVRWNVKRKDIGEEVYKVVLSRKHSHGWFVPMYNSV